MHVRFGDALDRLPLALLVDPDVDIRRTFAFYLQQSTCEVVEADDGRDALAKALARHPSIVVMEMHLPGIDGFDLCSLLRSDASTRCVPIVVVTGGASEPDIRKAHTSGADAVLVKPCPPEQLATEISRLLVQSAESRTRTRELRHQTGQQSEPSREPNARALDRSGRAIASRAFQRLDTTDPPHPPPQPLCPSCDRLLVYTRSHVGGVNVHHAEQWDYFECSAGCGTFQYRQRTHKLRRVE